MPDPLPSQILLHVKQKSDDHAFTYSISQSKEAGSDNTNGISTYQTRCVNKACSQTYWNDMTTADQFISGVCYYIPEALLLPLNFCIQTMIQRRSRQCRKMKEKSLRNATDIPEYGSSRDRLMSVEKSNGNAGPNPREPFNWHLDRKIFL
jgi:hypothetical protein